MTFDVTGRRVVVAGIAVSGVAVADVLLDRGASVVVVDARDGERERAAADRLRARGATVRLGDAQTPLDADLVVTSPGWRPTQPLLAAALAAGVEVVGEPELAWRLRPPDAAPWLAVTGTNGKTTTVEMLEAVLRAAGRRAVAVGNVGRPVLSAVLAEPAYDVLAVELSSFQLHWSPSLRVRAATVLNVAPDHLDWHGSMAAYAAAKARVWSADTVAVANADDAWSMRLWPGREGLDVSVTVRPPVAGQVGVADGVLLDRTRPGEPVVLAPVEAVHAPGAHNLSNALAAAALARVLDAPAAAVEAGLRAHQLGPHRNAAVAVVDDVSYVDDSKATNPHAAAASLGAYPSVVWVAGGQLKGADVDDLVRAHAGRLRGAVLLGVDRAPVAAALARHAPGIPVVEVTATDTGAMDEAVAAAAALARAGDTVLLAPAAASLDMFADYAARGDAFAAAVRRLGGR